MVMINNFQNCCLLLLGIFNFFRLIFAFNPLGYLNFTQKTDFRCFRHSIPAHRLNHFDFEYSSPWFCLISTQVLTLIQKFIFEKPSSPCFLFSQQDSRSFQRFIAKFLTIISEYFLRILGLAHNSIIHLLVQWIMIWNQNKFIRLEFNCLQFYHFCDKSKPVLHLSCAKLSFQVKLNFLFLTR